MGIALLLAIVMAVTLGPPYRGRGGRRCVIIRLFGRFVFEIIK